MSEFNCLEPGCDYHIGIAGVVETDEDFEAQDHYFQEIEEHQQMHDEQKKAIREVLPGAWDLLEKRHEAALEDFEKAEKEYNDLAVELANEAMIGYSMVGRWAGFLTKRDALVRANGVVIGLRELRKGLLASNEPASNPSNEVTSQD